ncbi:MAG: PAS domain S-box protein, partial [Betaproteobacteria bacterium]|nr:PAS domain S-box protein [Betaproteobacteria bacterium]
MDHRPLHAARVSTLFAVALPAYAGGTVLAAIVVALDWGLVGAPLLGGWLACVVALMLARLAVHRAYVRAPASRDDLAWERRFALGSFASGLLWALVPLFLLPIGNELIEAAVVIIVGGVIVAGVGLSSASMLAPWVFAAPPLAGLVFVLAMQPDATHRLLAGVVIFFALVMARMAREIHRSIVGALRGKLENQLLRERVEASETRLRDAIESCPEGIAVWDAEDRLVVCNQSYAALYGAGRTARELAGTPFERIASNAWQWEHPAGRADEALRGEWIAARVAVHRAGTGESTQYEGRDGRWRQGRTVRMRAGGWVGLVSDITELRSAQGAFEALLAEEDLVLDTLPVGIAFLERRVVTRCNRRLEQMLGYGPGELQGKSTLAWFANEGRWQDAGESAYRGLHGGAIMEADARLTRKDGTKLWCSVLGRALDPSAPERSAIFTFADIDDRVAAEKALRESQEKLRLAVEAADVVYWDWDRESGRVVWGDGHVRAWEDYRTQIHPEDLERYLAAVQAAWEGSVPYSCEYRVLGREGAVRWIAARGKTVPDATGRATRMIGVAQDISERKAKEET